MPVNNIQNNKNTVTVIATIKAKEDCVDLVKQELCKLVQPTRREYGCINYRFYQDKNCPYYFHSYENWTSMKAIEMHLKSNHIKYYMDKTKNCVDVFEIDYFNQIC